MRRIGFPIVLLAAILPLFAMSAQATPITSDTVQIRNASGTAILGSSSTDEGAASTCTIGTGTFSFQCETTSILVPFTYTPGTLPADVGIFFTRPDGSVSDFITVDFPTCCSAVGMFIYSDVEGSPFPSVAQFLAELPNLRTTSVAETDGLQNLTSLAFGLIDNPSLLAQVSPNFSFWAESDLGPEPVPEPATLTLTGLGLVAVVRRCRRSRSQL